MLKCGHEWVPHPDGKLHPIEQIGSRSWRSFRPLEAVVAAARLLPAPDNSLTWNGGDQRDG